MEKSFTMDISPNGFGCMYQSIIMGLAYCRKYRHKFKYTRFKLIHGIHNLHVVESLIGFLGKYETSNEESKLITYDHNLFGIKPEFYLTDEVLTEIRNNYDYNLFNIYNIPDYIAIHIRRGDINKKDNPIRWDDLDDYVRYIKCLKELYPHKIIYIVSQGHVNDFKLLTDNFNDLFFLLNGNPLESFDFLVKANILVISRSSFSYTASLLNKNIIYCDFIKNGRWFCKEFIKWRSFKNFKI